MPPHSPKRASSAATIEKKLAIVITATSRLATCVSSCASTPSISCGSRRFHRPCVTATTAFFWLRPVANAFGTSVGITATRGFGRSAIAASRSTIACNSGASSGPTTFAPEALSAILSDVKNWKNASAPMITTTRKMPMLRTFTRTTKKTT